MNEIWSQAQPSLTAIGWALVHSLWQVTAVVAFYAAARRLVAEARWRYRIGILLLGAAVALPAATAWQLASSRAPVAIADAVVALELQRASDSSGAAARAAGGDGGMFAPLEESLPIVAACWLVAVLALWTRVALAAATVHRLERREASAVPAELAARVRSLADQIGASRALRVLASSRIDVPCVVGFLRPTVLLPVATLTGLPAAHLEALVLHELAHVRRQDFLVNLVQTLGETLLFYHPAARWLSAEIRQEREHCCDDLVVAMTREPAEYALALATLERRRAALLSPAASSGNLRRRVIRLLAAERESRGSGFVSAVAVAGGFAFVVALATGWQATAGQPTPEVGREHEAPGTVALRAVLVEIEPELVDELTVSWETRRTDGLRQGTAETGTLLREIERPEARILSAPTVVTRFGEAAEVSTSGEDGVFVLQMLPHARSGEQLEIDVAFIASRTSSEPAGGKPRSPRRAIHRRLEMEAGRATILVGSADLVSVASKQGASGDSMPLSGGRELALILVATPGDARSAAKPADSGLGPEHAFGPEWTGDPMTLSLRESSLRELLGVFEERMGVRVEWSGDRAEMPDPPVTVELRDVPWDFALAYVLASSCMVVERQGESWSASAAPPGYQRRPGGSLVPCP